MIERRTNGQSECRVRWSVNVGGGMNDGEMWGNKAEGEKKG